MGMASKRSIIYAILCFTGVAFLLGGIIFLVRRSRGSSADNMKNYQEFYRRVLLEYAPSGTKSDESVENLLKLNKLEKVNLFKFVLDTVFLEKEMFSFIRSKGNIDQIIKHLKEIKKDKSFYLYVQPVN